MTDVVKKHGKAESTEQVKALHKDFSKKVADSGLTHKEIEKAVRKARTDVRKARRSGCK
ncbi:MAG: hypothetical protein ACOY40_12725 [Bacillota bacterium]